MMITKKFVEKMKVFLEINIFRYKVDYIIISLYMCKVLISRCTVTINFENRKDYNTKCLCV